MMRMVVKGDFWGPGYNDEVMVVLNCIVLECLDFPHMHERLN